MGYLYNRQFSKKAITYYLQAENILKNHPGSVAAKKSMASLCLNIGIEHMNVNDDARAVEYYFTGIQRYEAMDSNHFNLPILYGNIINSYINMGKPQSGLMYCEKAYTKSMATDNPTAKMSACFNYGRVMYGMGRFKEASFYFNKGEEIAQLQNDNYFLGKFYELRGSYSFEEKKYSEALVWFQKGLPYIKLTKEPYSLASMLIWLGAAEAGLKKFKESSLHLDTAYAITKQNDYSFLLKDVFRNRYHLQKLQGNYAAAINSLDSFNVLNDSIQHKADADRVEFADARYQAEKKEIQIAQLQAEKEVQRLNLQRKTIFNYALIAAAIVICLLSFLLFRNFKQKQTLQQQRISELETQEQLTATESVLKGEEQERTRLAKDLHDGLGGMLSGIKYSLNNMKGNLVMTPENAQAFERSMDMLDSSIKEMRRVAHNMMPEALVKFGLDTALNDFCAGINQSGALHVKYQSIGLATAQLEQTVAITIYRVVQELINNTMKHAAARSAIVQVALSDNRLSVTVEDDGTGFNTALLKEGRGIGWTNIQSRVDFLKGKLDVHSDKETGTSVHIELNV
jgi:two-component system, NarL family, sensor kinase